MKVFAWNPNGLRSLMKNNSAELTAFLIKHEPDVLFFPETKGNPTGQHQTQLNKDLKTCFEAALPNREWTFHHSYSTKALGRHGTSVAIASNRIKIDSITFGLGNVAEPDDEGRVIILHNPLIKIVGCYVPNASMGLKRLQHKIEWLESLKSFVLNSAPTPVMVIGDINVAPDERDLCFPKSNLKSPGYTPQEREAYSKMMEACALLDVWRHRNPTEKLSSAHKGIYTFWNTRSRARDTNAGWRIDLVLLSQSVLDQVTDCLICGDVKGSDHCPVGVILSDQRP